MRSVWFLALALASCTAPTSFDDAIDEDEGSDDAPSAALADDAADAATAELRSRTDGMTVWARSSVVLGARDGDVSLVARGRASRALDDAFSFVPDDAFGTTTRPTARTFEVALAGHETRSVLFGLPLQVRLAGHGLPGVTHFARLRFRSRLTSFSGASTIWVAPLPTPVLVGEEIVHRVVVRTASGTTALGARTGSVHLAITPVGGGRWHVDLSPAAIAVAAGGEPIVLTATARGVRTTKSARLAVEIHELALTTRDPELAWPFDTCDEAVLACLRALGGAPDTGTCGDAWRVTRCTARLREEPDPAAVFVADLRAHLAAYYELHAEDLAASEARSLAEAQAAVDVAQVYETDEDPMGHDLTVVRVLAHPDVVWASDAVWHGAYDRATGELLAIYDFN